MGLYKRTDSPYWSIRYVDASGRVIRESTKTKSKRDAERLLEKRRTDVFMGRHFERPTRVVTMARLWEAWEASRSDKATLSADRHRWKERIERFFGAGTSILTVKPEDVDRFKVWLKTKQTKQLSAATINHHLALLKSAYRLAARNRWISYNPTDGVQMEHKPPPRDRICSEDEFSALLEHAPSEPLRRAILMGYHTGMRLKAITLLEWRHVDLRHRIVHVEWSTTKTKQSRDIPMVKPLLEEMRRWDRSEPIIGKSVSAISQGFIKVSRDLGFVDLKYHDLRHTFATRLMRSGVNDATAMRLTGHADAKSLRGYQAVGAIDIRRAMDRLE